LRSRWRIKIRSLNASKSSALTCCHWQTALLISLETSILFLHFYNIRFITGSYDRTCKVWDTISGQELLSLEEHKNVVYTMAFNNPYGDKIVTGSFDRTAKIWDANTGQRYHTLKGHKMEIVCLGFDPHGMLVATGSMDHTAKLWDVETG